LGKFYQIDPETFLTKPVSELQRVVMWTDKLIERSNQESALDD
jgi:hypothetical protein